MGKQLKIGRIYENKFGKTQHLFNYTGEIEWKMK